MWVEFTASVTIKSSAGRAFDYFADYRHVAQVLEGVSKWEPIGPKDEGLGARFSVEMVAMGLPLRNVLRLNRWRRPEEIGWISEAGFIKQKGGFKFKELDGSVRIELHIAYEPPASILGAAVARRLDFTVRRRLERALENIRKTLES